MKVTENLEVFNYDKLRIGNVYKIIQKQSNEVVFIGMLQKIKLDEITFLCPLSDKHTEVKSIYITKINNYSIELYSDFFEWFNKEVWM